MAIVKMKKLRVMAMAACREELLNGLQKIGCIEISEPERKLNDPEWAVLVQRETSSLIEVRNQITDVMTALGAIKKYAKLKDGLFLQRKTVSEDVFLNEEHAKTALRTTEEILSVLEQISGLQNEEAKVLADQAALKPWLALDVPLELEGTAHSGFRQGVCPGNTDTSGMRAALSAADTAAELYEISADKQQKYYFLIFHKSHEEQVQEVLRPFNFSATEFRDMTGTVKEITQKLSVRIEEISRQKRLLEETIAQKASQRDLLRLYADRLGAEAQKQDSRERILTNDTVLFFEGWVPAEKEQDVKVFLERTDCAWDTEDPTEEEYPEVPVQLKNNRITGPLNMVTEMYALPAYNNVDPNPLMAPFFILFYGIMMADMGYGLLMFIAGMVITKKYRPKGMSGNLFNLMSLCGITTFVMGAITGGFFGDFLTQIVLLTTGKDFALPALFTPLDDTLMILIGSMALGFVHIITGMAISVVIKCKRGQFMDAFWNEITWWGVFTGIALLVLGGSPIVLFVGCALVVAGPLVTGKGVGKITGIFASLYSNVTGYFGDILSYSRLMALMLAGSVIAQVFNTLGAITGRLIPFLVISIVGNMLNFGLNLLGCYVHDLRLQCLEYFGKFYEDGGKPFRPLSIDTKFVEIQKN